MDEAYLDVTAACEGERTATAIAEAIRARIKAETGLTASAGVSYNKFIAKLASDHNKPDGLCVVTPRHGPAFVQRQPIGRFVRLPVRLLGVTLSGLTGEPMATDQGELLG